VVEFGDDISSAVLMSDILMTETASRTSVCLSLQFFISSSVVNMTIALSSSLENLTTSTQVVTTRSCHHARSCYWQETVSVDSGERLFIIANKFRITRGTVVFAAVADISLTPGNCSSDCTERKFSWSQISYRQNTLTQYVAVLSSLSFDPRPLQHSLFCNFNKNGSKGLIEKCNSTFSLVGYSYVVIV